MVRFFGKNTPEIEEKIIKKIFNYVDIKTLIQNARIVNKEWQKIIERQHKNSTHRILLYILSKTPVFENANPANILDIKKLNGGLTNKTIFFRIFNHENKFVARHPGKNSQTFIDRKSELFNTAIAYKYGLTAELIFGEEQGEQITRYLDQPLPMTPLLLQEADNLQKCVDVLKTIHHCGERFVNDTNVFQRNEIMLNLIEKNDADLPSDYKFVAKKMKKLQQLFDMLKIEKLPCHNDATYTNFIKSNGQIKLIDWEYSGNNDPIWDLACLSMEGEFTQEQDLQIFQAYFGNNWDNGVYQRFLLYKPVVEYWVALWTRVQIINENYPDNESLETLKNMEQKRFQNCMKLLTSPAFNTVLNSLKTSCHVDEQLDPGVHCARYELR